MNENTITRTPAWHTTGSWVRAENSDMTSAEALAHAGLAGWNVRKEPLFTGSGIEVPDRVATVRTDPTTGETVYLHYVGHNYTIQQNEDTFDFLDSLVDVSGAHYDAAGFMDRGKKIFAAMKMPEGIKIGGEDAVDLFILGTNGHDGNSAFTMSVVPIRLACTNQLTALVRGAQQQFKIRHTVNMAGRVTEARHSLELTFDYVDAFAAEMEMLLDASITDMAFEKLIEGVFPDAKTEGRQEAVDQKRADVFNLYAHADTNAFGRGTKYAAYNALTEYADWFRPVRGDDDGTKRAERIMAGGSVQEFKDYALAAVRAI